MRGASAPRAGRGEHRKQQVLSFIQHHVAVHGYPPSVREICQAVGLSSPSSVQAYINKLVAEGALVRAEGKARAATPARAEGSPARWPGLAPVLGFVGAGEGVVAEQRVEGYLPLPRHDSHPSEVFWLRVRGDSMKDAGILPGDFVAVSRTRVPFVGDIVVAGLEGEEATVKVLGPTVGGILTLEPRNPYYEPIKAPLAKVTIYGKVIALYRDLGALELL
jgi:repressor LexA